MCLISNFAFEFYYISSLEATPLKAGRARGAPMGALLAWSTILNIVEVRRARAIMHTRVLWEYGLLSKSLARPERE